MLVVQVILNVACGAGLNSLLVFALGESWNLSGDAVGLALTVMNACMLAGNLLVAQRSRLRPWTALILGMAARAGSLLLLTVAPSFPVFLIAMAIGAVGQGAVLSTVVMMRVKYLPGAVLGRASGLMWLITGAASLLSPALTPLFDRLGGPSLTFLLLGIATCGAVGHLYRRRVHWAAKPSSTAV
jgi:MFS family permease